MSQCNNQNKRTINEEKELIKEKKFKLLAISLFSGSDPVSGCIRIITHSKWSHCGIIIEDQCGIKYCFESTGTSEDVKKGIIPHVRIIPMDELIGSYEGSIATREILFISQFPDEDEVTNIINNYIGVPYEKNIKELIGSIEEKNTETKLDNIFCSELVAQILMDLGLLSTKITSNNYLPVDFSEINKILPLQGIALENENYIKKTKNRLCCNIF
jgi:hypothetical protein